MSKARVLIADDFKPTLEWVRFTLDGEFEVVGAVDNGLDAVAEVRRLDPDVLVIDLSMPILDGLRAIAQLGPNCRTKFVLMTIRAENAFVAAAFEFGASAYVVKSDIITDLAPAIRAALEGRKFTSQSIAQ